MFLFKIAVILLVRMWVEKAQQRMNNLQNQSSSLWGCELKNNLFLPRASTLCHPPCEDVSWKTTNARIVEKISSSSLWGCELKRNQIYVEAIAGGHPPCEDVSWKNIYKRLCSKYRVILLVRMWVENLTQWRYYQNVLVILLVRMWVEKLLFQT